MPCFIYLRADSDGITCNEPPDVILHRIEESKPEQFVHFELVPLARDDEPKTAYARAGDIVAVMPMHPRQLEHDMDDPPDWY
jgi:hypothetical protein